MYKYAHLRFLNKNAFFKMLIHQISYFGIFENILFTLLNIITNSCVCKSFFCENKKDGFLDFWDFCCSTRNYEAKKNFLLGGEEDTVWKKINFVSDRLRFMIKKMKILNQCRNYEFGGPDADQN